MPATASADITVKRGDNHTLIYKGYNEDGTPANLSASTWLVQVRQYPDSPTSYTYTVDTSQAASGIVVFTLPDTTTKTMRPGPYRYDIQETRNGKPLTPVEGSWTLTADVSRAS